MKKIIILLLALTIHGYSVTKGPCEKQYDVCCEEPKDAYAFSYAKDLNMPCTNKFYAFADFLYLRGSEEGLDYAITNRNTGEFATNYLPLLGGEMHGFSTDSHNWDWHPGLRVGFGSYLNNNLWNIEFKWTWLKVKNDASTSYNTPPAQGTLIAMWTSPDYSAYKTTEASARWTADINIIDLNLANPFHVNRHFVFNPTYGMKVAFIEQTYIARYGNASSPEDQEEVGTQSERAKFTAHNDYWGVGISGGLSSEWYLTSRVYFFGYINLALLYGNFDVWQRFNPSALGSQNEQRNNYYTILPNFEQAVGFCWSHVINKTLFSMKISYEFSKWFKQNQLRRYIGKAYTTLAAPVDKVHGRNLALNGLSLRCSFDF